MAAVVSEEENSLKVIGLMHVLPRGMLPVELQLSQRTGGEIEYAVRVGCFDGQWQSHTESKQWKLVYLHATEGHDVVWSWGTRVTGICTDARSWDSGNDA